MAEENNPFLISGYDGPVGFCDRENETSRLTENMKNGMNTTLLSIRRMGKTGLIHHVLNKLGKDKNTHCIYVDIYATQNLREFTNTLAASVIKAFPEKRTAGKKFIEWIKGFRPVFSFDTMSGLPEVSFDFHQPRQLEQPLAGIFSFLEKQKNKTIVAFDEFQQIAVFPEKNTEALLRTNIQPLKNVRFIFSGSNRHMLSEIFSHSKRPFFSSTQSVYLSAIQGNEYRKFIHEKFKKAKRTISDEAIDFILNFTRTHTWYTQALCNRIYASGQNKITGKFVEEQSYNFIKEQENVFYQYRSLLTSMQWNLLKAIAKEDKVYQPTSKQFLKKHDVGTPSNIQRTLQALLDMEMVYEETDEKGKYYRVYDCFLARWLEGK